ncbi:MAG: type II secretion system protein M [Deltaproteobacteria bacterium]|nr:type II secretion system protein M [Deltaproteobacteria bacterium]MBW2052195.1 type II secretion system protein M [Deltaproteobacteria bacterium]MBW2140766.1 type II secretion system protein M [Deltaproteobacteria bacterium]MBW2323666.1 type II secretion system protein M [Deltaproteobacteria bacterium]
MKLNQREIIVVSVGLVIIFCVGVYLFLLAPLADRRDRLKVVTSRLEKNLVEMRSLAAEYQALSNKQAQLKTRVQARGKDFAPFSYLETLARQAGLEENIESMTPMTSASAEEAAMVEFDVRLSGIGLKELVRFLYRIETSDKVLFINNLRIRPRYLTPNQLDVTLRVATPA